MQFYCFLYKDISHSIKPKTVESMYLTTQQRIKMNNVVLFRLLGYVLCVFIPFYYWFMTQSTCNDEMYGLCEVKLDQHG